VRRKPVEPEVYSISGARTSLSDDQRSRQRKYMISMTLRVICFGAAIFTDGPLRWVMLGGSIVLPWMAVVIANAGRESGRKSSQTATYQAGRELH
jgi:hypothetical protein